MTLSLRLTLIIATEMLKCGRRGSVTARLLSWHLKNLPFNESKRWHQYDIVICGGGIVGNTVACSLGQNKMLKHKRIVLLEAGSLKSSLRRHPDKQFSNRVFAITPGTRTFLNSLDVWRLIEQYRAKIVNQLKVFDSCNKSCISFKNEVPSEPVAFIVENDVILSALEEKLDSLKNVEVRSGVTVKKVYLPENADSFETAEIELSEGEKLNTKLVIGADGFNSSIRKAMDPTTVAWNYPQKAIVATLDVSVEGSNSTAFQRFTPTGPVALLPLTNDKTSLVWTTTTSEADRLMAISDQEFVTSLNNILQDQSQQHKSVNEALGQWKRLLGTCANPDEECEEFDPPFVEAVHPKSRASFPLGLAHPLDYVAARAVLVGDAAHRCHPLAGQGLNLGFRDVQCLTSVLEDGVSKGKDIGSLSHLQSYEGQRQLKNASIMFGLDWLNRLYSSDWLPVSLVRSLGLTTVNSMPGLKAFFMAEASK